MSGLHMFIAYTLPELKRKIIVKSDYPANFNISTAVDVYDASLISVCYHAM